MSAIEHVFGANAEIHPVTRRPIETGIGALPVERQAELHIADVEREEGAETADEMRRQLGIPTQAEIEAAAKAKAEEERQREVRLGEREATLLEREADLDAREQAVAEREKAAALKRELAPPLNPEPARGAAISKDSGGPGQQAPFKAHVEAEKKIGEE